MALEQRQLDTKLITQIEKVAAIADKIPSAAVKEKDTAPVDPASLTTLEEQEQYDLLIEKDFFKIEKPLNTKRFFRVSNCFPNFQSSNFREYIATFAVEEWEWSRNADGTPRRQPITSFHMKAKDFLREYRPTVSEVAAE